LVVAVALLSHSLVSRTALCIETACRSLKRLEHFIPMIQRLSFAILVYESPQFVYVTSLEYVETEATKGLSMNVIELRSS
jgi:hypothetical protein